MRQRKRTGAGDGATGDGDTAAICGEGTGAGEGEGAMTGAGAGAGGSISTKDRGTPEKSERKNSCGRAIGSTDFERFIPQTFTSIAVLCGCDGFLGVVHTSYLGCQRLHSRFGKAER